MIHHQASDRPVRQRQQIAPGIAIRLRQRRLARLPQVHENGLMGR